jgi:hypothetical protein
MSLHSYIGIQRLTLTALAGNVDFFIRYARPQVGGYNDVSTQLERTSLLAPRSTALKGDKQP